MRHRCGYACRRHPRQADAVIVIAAPVCDSAPHEYARAGPRHGSAINTGAGPGHGPATDTHAGTAYDGSATDTGTGTHAGTATYAGTAANAAAARADG